MSRWSSLPAGTAVTALLVAALGCGGDAPTLMVRNTAIFVRSDVPFARQSDFGARLESTVGAALEYWGGTWEQLDGKSIAFEGAAHVRCVGVDAAIACYDGDIRVSTQDAGSPLDCVEETALVHEIGHAIIGDPEHGDPRWMDFLAVARRLEGRRGYGRDDGGNCPIHVSMWRHAPAAQMVGAVGSP